MTEHHLPQNKTAGELLKETRESRNFSLLSVHEATKIPMDVLKAIEEGYSVRSLSPFYLKGFIKMYAEYLGVNPDKILERPVPVLKKAMEPSKPKITQLPEKKYKVSDIDDFDLNRFVSKENQRLIVQIIAGIIALLVLIRFIGCFMAKKGETTKKTAAVVEAPVPSSAVVVSPREIAQQKLVTPEKQTVTPPKQDVKPAVVKEEPVIDEKSAKVHLTIKAQKGGWLQVRVDGNVVMESTVNAGMVKTWQADQEIVISGRTIHNLEFELNGKMLGTLGRQDRNARRVVITRKGLAVKG